MAAGQESYQRALDDLVLAEDDGRCGLVDALNPLASLLDAADNGFVSLCECAHDGKLYAPQLGKRTTVGKDGQNMNRYAGFDQDGGRLANYRALSVTRG